MSQMRANAPDGQHPSPEPDDWYITTVFRRSLPWRDRWLIVAWWIWCLVAAGAWAAVTTDYLALSLPIGQGHELALTVWRPTWTMLMTVWVQAHAGATSRQVLAVHVPTWVLVVGLGLIATGLWHRPGTQGARGYPGPCART